MKNLLYLFLIGVLFSCGGSGEDELNPEEPDVNGEPKEYIVSLGMTGEIEISESPLLGRASSDDLYGINVYYKAPNSSNYHSYASGVFDNKSGITIKLLEGYKYRIEATMIVNGKNVTPYYEKNVPFAQKLTNQFSYNTNCLGVERGAVYMPEFKYYLRPNIDRFYGKINEYIPEEEGEISIDMKRVVFGAKYIAENLTEGKIIIEMPGSPTLYIECGVNNEIEEIFTFSNEGYIGILYWDSDDYFETIPVTISWEKADGAIVPLVSQDITFKRKTLTTITIKVKDSSVNNGVEINQEGGDLIAGDNITLESGTGVDNPVNPDI
ncbi:hypothetical protein [Butyricimonas virosa]